MSEIWLATGEATILAAEGQYTDAMPEVLESAVIGVPHAEFGEAVTAVLVLKPAATLTAHTTIARLKAMIANFKVPKQVHFVAELPRNTMGKVQKNLLRQQFQK